MKKISDITLLVFMVFCFSCKEKQGTTFHSQIIEQQLLNKTETYNNDAVDIYKIKYLSDGLNIEGFIARPTQLNKLKKLPVIVYCRGGNKDYGMISPRMFRYFNYLAANGYVVVASQLRGNTSSEGVDEFGGKDVNDILNLIKITKDLDFVDAKNIHVLGYSRGGMNAYQVSKQTDNINSIAVVGGSTTLFNQYNFRPEMYHNVAEVLIGDSVTFKKEYEKRSAVFWHKELNEPTLILHGAADKAVHLNEAQQLIDSLNASNKKDFEYKIFEGGNHGLSNFKQERNELIFNWFKTHNK